MRAEMTDERTAFRKQSLVDHLEPYSFKEIGEALDVIGFEAFRPRPDQVAQMEMFQIERLHEQMDKAVESNLGAAKKDMVVLPEHYARYKIEPIRFIVENYGPGFLIGNIIKYVMRYDAKNGAEDIKKAQRYAVMLQRFEAKDNDWWRAE